MKIRVLTASLLAAILLIVPVAAVGFSGSDGMGGDMIDGADNFANDLLPDVAGTTDERYADSSLGDTDGDGVIDTTESRTDATDTAQSSSGEAEESGMSAFGVILTVVIIGAVVVLIFALIPKKREM